MAVDEKRRLDGAISDPNEWTELGDRSSKLVTIERHRIATVVFEGTRHAKRQRRNADMTAQLVALGFDANDPLRLARFWAETLRWDVGDETGDVVSLVPTDGTRFRIDFGPVPEPNGTSANRLHLDVTTTFFDDHTETVERLIELGGRHIDIGLGPEDEHVVLADPEGNELCIIEAINNFL